MTLFSSVSTLLFSELISSSTSDCSSKDCPEDSSVKFSLSKVMAVVFPAKAPSTYKLT